jgi:drug/metabolite transporter (DMT)-like permease
VGTGLLVFAATGFGTLGLSSREAGELGLDALGYSTWRSGLGGLALFAWVGVLVAARRPALPRGPVSRSARLAMLAAGGASTLLNLAVFMAFERTTIALVLITFYTYPALVAVAATRLYGESLDRRSVLALLLAFSGLVLVVVAPAIQQAVLELDALGLGLAFLAACLQAVYVLIIGRGFSSVPSSLAAAIVVSLAGAAYVGLSVATGQVGAVLSPFEDGRLWPWVLMAAIVGAAAPTAAMLSAVRRVGPTRTSILMMLEPVVGVALAALFLAERPVPLQLVGGTAVLVAGIILQARPITEPPHGRPPAAVPLRDPAA